MKTQGSETLILRGITSGLLVLGLTACGGSSKTDTPVAGTCESSQATVATASFDELWTNVFSKQCSSCHGVAGNTSTENGPDMTSADAFYTGMVGKKGTAYDNWETFQTSRAGCVNASFIEASNANASLVTAVLDSSVAITGCTVKYHRENPQNVCITAANLVKLKEWINAGASR